MRNADRVLIAALAALSLFACDTRPPAFGVAVFSTDTVPVTFTVNPTGSLGLTLRAGAVHVQPDKSLLVMTPAEMTWAQGSGTARIEGLKGGRLAVKPIGVPPDSADTTTVEGRVVILAIPPERRVVSLKAEKP